VPHNWPISHEIARRSLYLGVPSLAVPSRILANLQAPKGSEGNRCVTSIDLSAHFVASGVGGAAAWHPDMGEALKTLPAGQQTFWGIPFALGAAQAVTGDGIGQVDQSLQRELQGQDFGELSRSPRAEASAAQSVSRSAPRSFTTSQGLS
jgi:hypothetical protein